MLTPKEITKLPPSLTRETWYLLAPWSNLKHPKKWMGKKRLRNKFCKNRERYISQSILCFYYTPQELLLFEMYEKAKDEMMAEEDKILLKAVTNKRG